MNIFKTKYYYNIHQNLTLQNPFCFNVFSREHFPQPPQKGMCNEISTTRETCPHFKSICKLFYGIYRKGGWFCMYVGMYFKIFLEVVKIIHVGYANIINMISWILDISISLFRNFLKGGGVAQNLSLPPGVSYPRYATGSCNKKCMLLCWITLVHDDTGILFSHRLNVELNKLLWIFGRTNHS